jgi:hypothetical protein
METELDLAIKYLEQKGYQIESVGDRYNLGWYYKDGTAGQLENITAYAVITQAGFKGFHKREYDAYNSSELTGNPQDDDNH